ncbi:MAG: hypothetical protein ACLSB9_35265 [Hydrogeniiclostridium mannosilyticum]
MLAALLIIRSGIFLLSVVQAGTSLGDGLAVSPDLWAAVHDGLRPSARAVPAFLKPGRRLVCGMPEVSWASSPCSSSVNPVRVGVLRPLTLVDGLEPGHPGNGVPLAVAGTCGSHSGVLGGSIFCRPYAVQQEVSNVLLLADGTAKVPPPPVWLAFVLLPVFPAILGTGNYLGNIEVLDDAWYSL